MTLPDSYLDTFAQQYEVPTRSLQLDGGNGTGGRMSAPTTRVFLLPAALYLTRLSEAPGQLWKVLNRAWKEYDLDLSTAHSEDSSPVRFAATLSDLSDDGVCRLLLYRLGEWRALIPWVEQLMEESLGKGGKGIVVFGNQTMNTDAPGFKGQAMAGLQLRKPVQAV